MKKLIQSLVAGALLSLAVALSGCGGGGGGGGGGGVTFALLTGSGGCFQTAERGCLTQEEFQTQRDSIAQEVLVDSEFAKQGGMETVNAHQAHAAITVLHGADAKPGTGVTIGVIDSGVDLGHSEFQDAAITETLLQGVPDETNSMESSHGTSVTSVIAAQPDNKGFSGVAYGANFKIFAAPIGGPYPATYDPDTYDWEQAYKSVLAADVDIVNASYASSETFVENYTSATKQQIYAAIPEALVVAQKGVADPTIFVWAAGNDHGLACDPDANDPNAGNCNTDSSTWDATSPNIEGGLVALLDDWQGHNVVVVALDTDGEIADFSNRCGIAGDWCIAAPGVDVETAYFGSDSEDYKTVAGTSFAAPMVTGGLALMKQFFRDQVPNTWLVTRLFQTADRDSDKGYDNAAIYGQGLMDLGAAVSPVGDLKVTTDSGVSDAGHILRNTRLRLGSAFGDGLANSLLGREIVAFDSTGGAFWFGLPGLTDTSASRPSAAARLRDLMAPRKETDRPAARGTRLALTPYASAVDQGGWRFGLYESPATAESSLLNLAENAVTLAFRAQNGLEATAFTTTGLAHQQTAETGAVLAWRPEDTPFGLRLGWLGEQETLLGSTTDGAFGRASADSVVVGFEAATEISEWRLGADTEIGLIMPEMRGGVIADVSGTITSAFSLRAHRRLSDDDEITFSLSQPPRVEHGRASLRLPVGRTKDGAVLHESISADLVPSGRQIDLAARWHRASVLGGEFRAEAYVSHDPGHVDAKLTFGLLAGWRVAF